MKTTPTEIGMRYNSTLARQEAEHALGLARPREVLMNEQGITPRQLGELAAYSESLYPLDLAQSKTQQALQNMTDLVERLLSRSVSTISRVYILADVALGKTDPDALASLPSRSHAVTVSKAASALLTCAQFVAVHQEAFLAAGAPAVLQEELLVASRELSEADKMQEKCKLLAQEASNALFQCRGEVYLGCKRIYQAGRNLYRQDPQVRAMFSFVYMARSSRSTNTDSGDEAKAKLARNVERKAALDAIVQAKREAAVQAKAAAAKAKADAAKAKADAAEAKAAAAQSRLEAVRRGGGPGNSMMTGRTDLVGAGDGSSIPQLIAAGRGARLMTMKATPEGLPDFGELAPRIPESPAVMAFPASDAAGAMESSAL